MSERAEPLSLDDWGQLNAELDAEAEALTRDEMIYAEMCKPERAAKFWSRIAPGPDGGFQCLSFTCSAHRVAWMLSNGRPVPTGMEVDHTCRRPSCCAPAHLEAVVKRENVARSFGRSLATQAEVARSGPASIHVRRRVRGDRFLVTWRDHLVDGSVVQRGQSFGAREEAESFARTR